MNKNQDAQQLVSEEQVEVRLKIPPGDYREIVGSDNKLMDKIAEDEAPPACLTKKELRSIAYDLIEPHIIEGPKINALNRRNDS